jgi:hypothetical protein
MAFMLIESAQQRWLAVNGPHLVALVRAGATFEKGLPIERPNLSRAIDRIEVSFDDETLVADAGLIVQRP